MRRQDYRAGEPVIYRMHKYSAKPGPRAKAVAPAQHGEGYDYTVDKLWVVVEVRDDGLVLRTRRGKSRLVSPDDPNLRRPRLWERWLYRHRFPQLAAEA